MHQKNLIRFLNWCLLNRDALVNVKGAFQSAFWALDQDLSHDAKEEVELYLGTKIAAAAISGSCACVAHVVSQTVPKVSCTISGVTFF